MNWTLTGFGAWVLAGWILREGGVAWKTTALEAWARLRRNPRPRAFSVEKLFSAALFSGFLGLGLFWAFVFSQSLAGYRSERLPQASMVALFFSGLLVLARELLRKWRLPEGLGWSAWVSFPAWALPLIVAVSKNKFAALEWYHYEFLDKRWLFAAYVVATTALVIVPPAVFACLRGKGDPTEMLPQRESGALSWTLLGLTALAGWTLGPPWRIGELHWPMELHELVHLGGLQGIQLGKVPYAEAQVQYGPGLQYLSYLYMRWTSFDLVHLRESFALLNFLGALVLFWGLAFLLPAAYAWGAALFALLAVSPLTFYGFESGRILWGFFGWGNPWRYLGVFILLAGFHQLTWRVSRLRSRVLLSMAVGFVWGFFSWISQENLASCATALGIYVAWMAAAGPLSVADIFKQFASVVGGFLAFWGMVISYYASHQVVGLFFRNYFMVSGLVTQGYSNTPFNESYFRVSYFITPYLAWGLALFAMWSRKSREFFGPLAKEENALLLAGVAMVLGGYQNSLFRSDNGHYSVTMIGLSLMLFSFLRILESLKMRVAFALCFAFLFPIKVPTALKPNRIPELAVSLFSGARKVPVSSLDRLKLEKAGPAVLRVGMTESLKEHCCHGNGANFGEFYDLMNSFKSFCGTRKTVVDSFVDYNGYVYFFADLVPALNYTENHHFLFNSAQVENYGQLLAQTDYQCAIGMNPDAPVFTLMREKGPERLEKRIFTLKDRQIFATRRNSRN